VKRTEAIVDFAAFAGTVAVAALQRWQAKDLIWSLWISSLILGYAFIVTSALSVFFRAPEGNGSPARSSGALPAAFPLPPVVAFLGRCLFAGFLLVFFTIHFGMFHFVHGMFLGMFFPLAGWNAQGNAPAFVSGYFLWTIGATARAYWPFVAMSALSRLGDFRTALGAPGGPNMSMPYANVVRMHVMIFVFAGLHGAGLAAYAVYPVLMLYFFPAGALARLALRTRRMGRQPATHPYSSSRAADEGSSRSKRTSASSGPSCAADSATVRPIRSRHEPVIRVDS
jgi:hypothetical protein